MVEGTKRHLWVAGTLGHEGHYIIKPFKTDKFNSIFQKYYITCKEVVTASKFLTMFQVDNHHLAQAVKWLTEKQGHPALYSGQMFQLESMVNRQDSISQTPTGSGKSYAGLCLPDILLFLRNQLGYVTISDQPRVLYIVPLVAIMESLEEQLVKLDISYQFLRAGTTSFVNDKVKVVIISPEKLTEKETLASVTNLDWSAIVLDEGRFQL